jgi:prepilin-type N-terminal cleavage/methylation domain-containing protein
VKRPRQRGFTILELLVALLISSLLVGMILAIFLRMSLAYRSQQEIAGVQDVLQSARSWIERDAKQAGYGMAQGFTVASSTTPPPLIAPVTIVNSNTGPDQVSFHYADPTLQALVTATGEWTGSTRRVQVDDVTGFEEGMVVVMSTPDLIDGLIGDGKLAIYDACVVQISGISTSPPSFEMAQSAPWGGTGLAHCSSPVAARTMIYRFVARTYRIDPDPARAALGVLQLSKTGVLNSAAAFEDIGMNFTDLQLAAYFFEPGDLTDTLDPDTDPQRDWYSSTLMATKTLPAEKGVSTVVPMLQLSVSLVARTGADREGLGTAYTPKLVDDLNVNNNTIGDRNEIDLAVTSNPSLEGNRLYRHTTFYVDLRNIGVGR